jgi:hypothetical protein
MHALVKFDDIPWVAIDKNGNEYSLNHSVIVLLYGIDAIQNKDSTELTEDYRIQLNEKIFLGFQYYDNQLRVLPERVSLVKQNRKHISISKDDLVTLAFKCYMSNKENISKLKADHKLDDL